MGGVRISVRGSHRVAVPPQRATVYASVGIDGPDRDAVFAAAVASLAALRASIESLAGDGGPVRRFAVDQVRVGSHRPWNADGERLPLVHTATASVTVRFGDLDALAGWVSAAAAIDGVAIGGIDWMLTRRRRARLERRARQEALRDARRRAQDYADALGLGRVRVRAISDPGVGGPAQRKVMLAAAAVPGGAGEEPELDLAPEDVEIEAYVEATFGLDDRI